MGTCVSDLVESRSPEHGTTTINSKSAGSHAPFHTDLEFLDSRTENASGNLIYEMDSKASMNDRSNVDSGAELSTSDLPLSTVSIATASTGIGPTLPLDMGTDNRREAHSASDFGLSLSCCEVDSNNVDSGVDLAKSATNPPTRLKLSRAQTLCIANSDSKSSIRPADTVDEMAEIVHTANTAHSDLTGHSCLRKDSSSDSDNCDIVSLCSTCSCRTCSSCGSGVYVCSSVDCTCCMADMSSREDEGDDMSEDVSVKTNNIDPIQSTDFGHCYSEPEGNAISSDVDMEANGDHTKSTINVLNDVMLTTKSVADMIVNNISAHGSTSPVCFDSRHNVTHSDSAVKDSSLVSPVGCHSDRSSDGEESDTFSLCSTCTSWGTCSSCGSDIDICSSKDYPCKAGINSDCYSSTCSDGDDENQTNTHAARLTDSELDTSNNIGFTEMTDSVDLAVCSSAVELEGCEQSVADDTESLCVEANVDQEAHLRDLSYSPQSDVSTDAGTTAKAITLSVVDLTRTVEFEERAQTPVKGCNSELTSKASGSQDQTYTRDETRAPIRDDNSRTRLDVSIHSKSDFKSDIQDNSDDCLSRLSLRLSDVDESDMFSLCSTCSETCSSCESGSYICSSEDCPCKADMSLWTSSDEEIIDRDALSLEERIGNDHVHKTNFSDLRSETKTDSSFDAAKCTSAVELEGHVLSLAEGCSLELNSSTSATQHEASNDEMTINATTTGADYGVCDSPAHSGITFHLKTESDLKDTQFSPDNHHLNPSLSANEDSDAHSLCSTCSCETCSSCGSGSYVCSCEDCARVASTTTCTSSDEDNEIGPRNFDEKSTDHVHERTSLTIKPTDISTDNTEVKDYTQPTALTEDHDPVHERPSPTIDISTDSTEMKDCYLESTLIKSTCAHSQAVSNALHTQEQTILDEASYRMKFMPPSGNFESASPVNSVLTPQLRTDIRDGPFLMADNSPSSSDGEDSDTVSCCSTCSCTCSCSSCSTCDCSCVEDCDLCRLDGYDTDNESMHASDMEVTDSDYDGDIEDLI